ncbi:thiolase family protein [Pseudonocardia abyssalis]|uniref:Thiolase family protein n=1 Tax=Pseudonocardia abyssalis TaxID=2792008 RepID=A0ABS6UVK2_9PSEU|nr:thiolase family protein [Pseudonocardia abyssalis]MBW0113784.1 thiolase family protein [Pseudonocardia abyssalis]MBW0136272.1 thiolase family protein [Pseudonocardia abyssalis]
MSAVAVHGVGTSHFGRQPERDLVGLAFDAVHEAFADAGVDAVDAVWVGTVFGPAGVAQRVLRAMGVTGVPIVTVENACASGTTAFAEAHEAVRTGRYGRVLALGVEQMSTAFAGAITPEPTDPEGRSGLALPALYAMAAARYLHLGAVTPEQLAAVSVKNHAHALHNPRAQYSGRHTVEEVLASRMIADPLTLLQCCPTSDGAAAAVLAPATGGAREVAVRGVAMRTGAPWNHASPHVWGHDVVRDTAADAFAAAGLAGASDVDVLEVHDAFTIGEIVTTEALGLAPAGGGGEAAAAGVTALGGAHPVNPSGGLLSRGHPLGATGLAQLAEITWQLRGEAAGRQVEGARIGVVETMGGGVSVLDGNACVVAVLEAP